MTAVDVEGSRGVITGASRGIGASRNGAVIEKVLEQIPLRRIAELRDVAAAVVFAASPAAGMVTGSSIVVDGGWLAR